MIAEVRVLIQTTGLQFDYNSVLSWPDAVQSNMGVANKLNCWGPAI